ncbi:MAG: sulfite exporter TauE/SafE family protein [Fimbriimonadaceae bacterium]
MLPELEPWQWGAGIAVALMVGLAKTGIPGVGILVVPLMPLVFPGRLSVGALLPLLVFADFFAVAYYHAHAQWGHVRKLAPGLAIGMFGGTVFLWTLGQRSGRDWMNPIIGALVLGMLGVYLLRNRLGDRWTPRHPAGVATSGFLAGFTTLVSNAAGPVMTIYMAAFGLDKRQFMGTGAWLFLVLNLSKVPVYLALTAAMPDRPMMTIQTFAFNVAMIPAIVVGALAGKRVFERIPERWFADAVLLLAAVAAVRLLFA